MAYAQVATRKQLKDFVRTRNRSGYSSNLQFQIDAHACGISVDALGTVQPFKLDGFKGYQWKPILVDGSEARLVEFGRTLHLEGDRASAEMFALMPKAVFE